MTALAITQTIIGDGISPVRWHNSAETNGRQDYNIVEMRDATDVWFDADYYLNFSTGTNTSVAHRFLATTYSSDVTNYGIYYPSLHRDCSDNLLLIYYIGNNYPHLSLRITRYVKPTGGWKAWAENSSRPALTQQDYTPFSWQSAMTDYQQGNWNFSGFHIAKVANISNGVLYCAGSPSGSSQNGYNTTDYIGFTVNLNTMAIITYGSVSTGNYTQLNNGTQYYLEGNTAYGRGFCTMQPFQPFSSQGVRTSWYNYQGGMNDQNTTYNNRNNGYNYLVFSRFNIDANGVLTSGGWNGTGGTRFGINRTVDMEAASGNVSAFTYTHTHGPLTQSTRGWNGSSWVAQDDGWYGNAAGNQIIVCTIFNGKPTLNTMQGYYDQPNSEDRPYNWTYASTPTNWVFNARCAPTIAWMSPTILRMYGSNGTNGAYMDITWDGSNFIFPASATAISGFSSNAHPKSVGSTLLDRTIVFSRNAAQADASTTGLSSSYTYAGPIGSFPEPYVPVLKANNGMKFQYVSSATYTSANASRFGTTNNYIPAPWSTFQFKRVSSGTGTEYYDYTTSAWTSSVVNNAATLFPSGGGVYAPDYLSTSQFTNDLQGTWADNTSYTYSYTFTDPNGVSLNTNTKVIATPAVSAAPTAPTPRRMFVYTLQNRTSSHVLSVENRVLINKVNLVNKSANSVGVSLNLAGYEFLSNITLAPYQTAQFETAVIANATERLLATCNADASVDMWIMGTEGV